MLDASGSMLRNGRLAHAKGVLGLLMQDAVRRGERVALLSFSGGDVTVRLPPGHQRAWRDHWISPLGGGGGTPVGQALRCASSLLARHARQRPDDTRWLWLLTDGRTLEDPPCPDHVHHLRIVDFDEGRSCLGRTSNWAAAWSRRCDVTNQPASDLAPRLDP